MIQIPNNDANQILQQANSNTNLKNKKNKHAFTITDKNIIELSQLKYQLQQKVQLIIPSFNDTYIVLVSDRNKNKRLKHCIKNGKILDCQYFQKSDSIIGIQLINSNLLLVSYVRERKSCFVLQWDFSIKSKTTIKIQTNNKNQTIYYTFFSFKNTSQFCIIEQSYENKKQKKQEQLNKQIFAKFADYLYYQANHQNRPKANHYKFYYYKYPIKSVIDKPVIQYYLSKIYINYFTKINQNSKIGFTLQNMLQKYHKIQFYVIKPKQKDYQNGKINFNACDRVQQYTLRHGLNPHKQQSVSTKIQTLFEVLPGIFYIKCKTNKRCCNEGYIRQRYLQSHQLKHQCTHSYIWQYQKQKNPFKLDFVGGHQHSIQFLDCFRNDVNQNLHRMTDKLKQLCLNHRGLILNKYVTQLSIYYVNPYDMSVIDVRNQQIFIKQYNKIISKSILPTNQKNGYVQFFQNQGWEIITQYKFTEIAFGRQISLAFILLQLNPQINQDFIGDILLLICQAKQNTIYNQGTPQFNNIQDYVHNASQNYDFI